MKLYRAYTLGLVLVLLAGCGLPPTAQAPFPPTSLLPVESRQPQSSPEPSPAVQDEDTLVICSGSLPVDLFLYSEPSYIKSVLLAMLYDGPIELVGYEYQPVLLTRLPSLAEGDAWIESVEVQAGDLVMDASGALAVLGPGARLRPAGCRSEECAINYQGGALQMDRMQVLFNLRPGIQWADGAPLTADDSVFSYQLARAEEVLYGNAGLVSQSAASFTFTADYSALDANTVQWTGRPGFLDPDYALNFFSPLPEHQLGGTSAAELLEMGAVLYSPLGWGPYQVSGWESGQSLTLAANPTYEHAAEGLPYFRRVELRLVGPDPAASLQAFRDGQCDLLLQDALPAVPDGELLDLVEQGRARLVAHLQPRFEQLTFNVSPADPLQRTFFSDPRMRRAAALCIDRPALARQAYAGLVPALEMAFPLDHPLLLGAPASLLGHDPQQAGQLLAELGWLDENQDGLREAHAVSGLPDSTPLIVHLALSEEPQRLAVSQALAVQLQECGFQLVLDSLPARELFAHNAQALAAGRRFDLLATASAMDFESLCGLSRTEAISGEANTWSGSNLSGFSLPALDQACTLVRASLPGTPEYTTSRQSVLRLLNEFLPFLPLFRSAEFSLARADLRGLTAGVGQSVLQDIERFRLEP